MKKILLTLVTLAVGWTGAWAYTTHIGLHGENQDEGVISTVENGIQYFNVPEGGAFARLLNKQHFKDEFNKAGSDTYYRSVVFQGTMNQADFTAITSAANAEYNDREPKAGPFYFVHLIDFTNVSTTDKPFIEIAENYWGNFSWCDKNPTLIIWPACIDPTLDDLKSMYEKTKKMDMQIRTCYAYYTGNNNFSRSTLKMVAHNAEKNLGAITDQLKILMDAEALTFQAMEFAYSWNGTAYQYTNNVLGANFLANLGKLPVVSLNLWGVNISSIGTNFSALNDATKYIILPANKGEYAAGNDFATFTYNENVCVVAAHVSKNAPYGKGGDLYGTNHNVTTDPLATGDDDFSMTLTYVRKPNELYGGAAYLPVVMQTADKMVMVGTLGDDDFEALNHMECWAIDMNKVTLQVEDKDITDFNNTYTQWLAVPNNTRPEQVDELYSAICTNTDFKGIVGFTTAALDAEGTNRAVPTNTLITYTKEQGCVYNLVFMIDEAHTGQFASGVKNLIMSGRLNAFDICNEIPATGVTLKTETSGTGANAASYTMVLASDGHLYSTSNLPEGESLPVEVNGQVVPGTTLSNGALDGAYTFDLIDFTNALFDQPAAVDLVPGESCPGYFSAEEKQKLITDMNFTALSITPSNLLLPTDPSQKVIPPFFLTQSGGYVVSELCIPYNFQYIMDGAFNLCGSSLFHIYTTADPNEAGLISTEADHGVEYKAGNVYKSTYTIGSAVKYIGTAAFDTNDAANVSDVYVLAKVAPTCEPNAFNSSTLIGNNGFELSHPINRDCYINSKVEGDNTGANHWIAVLHFPNALNDAQKKKYTDTDRVYLYSDETGAVDGEGNLIRWPAHTEFLRSYNQANYGYTWYQWDPYRTGLPGWGNFGEAIVTGPNDFTAEVGENVTLQKAIWDENLGCYVEEQNASETMPYIANDCSKCKFANTIGWHQFLLAQPGYFYEHESLEYEQTPWYTFCVPFDMTKDELQEYLGVPEGAATNAGAEPDVRTLIKVKREPAKTHTTLVISKNLLTINKDVVTYGQSENLNEIVKPAEYVNITRQKDEIDVYVKGGYPYFVRGWVPKGMEMPKNLGQYVLAQASFDTPDLGNVIIVNDNPTMPENGGDAVDLSGNITATKMYANGDENFIAMPWLNHTIDAVSVENGVETPYGKRTTLPTGIDEDVPMLYTFIGNYEQQDFMTLGDKLMPLYSYYMTNSNIYRYKTQNNAYIWKPYICMIGRDGERSVVQVAISGRMTYHSGFENVLDDNKWGKNEFAQGESAGIGTFSIEFEDDIIDGETNQITNLNGEDIIPVGSAIYNLSGQYMGTSINKLKRGVYVIGGKKFVVQ